MNRPSTSTPEPAPRPVDDDPASPELGVGRFTVADLAGVDLAGLDLVPEGVVVLDGEGRVAHANDRARDLLGLPSGDLSELHLAGLVELRDDTGESLLGEGPPTSGVRVAERLAERVLLLHCADGRTRPVAVCGRHLAEDGTVLTFRHAGARERRDAARSELVATVSHEIRSPLTSVKGFTRTMLAKWDRFSDDQKRQMLETINADADRVTRLLTELLDVSRIDAGRVRLERRMSEVAPLVQRLIESFDHRESTPPMTLQVEAPGRCYVDTDKLEQVLVNLLENALQHAPGSPVEVTIDDDGDEVRISVADRGPGIPPRLQRKVFTKFSTGGDGRRAGNGLGLYITRGLVEAHGGRVWVESEPGHGASFHVALPAGEPTFPGLA